MTDEPKDEPKTANLPAVIDPTIPAVTFQSPEQFKLSVWSSLPPERGNDLLMALQSEAEQLRDFRDEVIDAEHVVAHRVELVNQETGEVEEADRIVIIAKDGTMYASVSAGIRRSLQLLMMVHGMPPWKQPVRVQMVEVQTRRGRRLYQLLPADAVKAREKRGK